MGRMLGIDGDVGHGGDDGGEDDVPVLGRILVQGDFNALENVDLGGRWSAYISADMRMMPCSFAHENNDWSVSLREHTIQKAWESEAFENFRHSLGQSCPDCSKRELYMGDCPILPEIVLCRKSRR